MTDKSQRKRLEMEAIILGYAMSRLDARYLRSRNMLTWRRAFEEAATSLSISATSIKNLRDEFDPVHGNSRRGWYQRPLRPNRQRVLADLLEVSDDALMELVDRILGRDEAAFADAVDSMATPPRTAYNVAERLLTGRRAEDYFLSHSDEILGIRAGELVDRRQAACGYDFEVVDSPDLGVEVKGIKEVKGDVLFTDREWIEAGLRRDNYWLVIVGNLVATPRAKVVRNPHQVLRVRCYYQATVAATWRSAVTVLS